MHLAQTIGNDWAALFGIVAHGHHDVGSGKHVGINDTRHLSRNVDSDFPHGRHSPRIQTMRFDAGRCRCDVPIAIMTGKSLRHLRTARIPGTQKQNVHFGPFDSLGSALTESRKGARNS